MISLYSGTPGSGKSLDVARYIYHRLRYNPKAIIIANFEINLDKIKGSRRKPVGHFIFVPNDKLTAESCIEFADRWRMRFGRPKEGQFVLIIDECQLLFNARDWSAKGRKEWLSFFTQHRKYGYNIILIAQFDRMIDRQIRSLIEYEIIHRKVGNIGFFGRLVAGFGNNLYIRIAKYYPMQMKVDSEWFRGKKCYFDIYDTFKDFGTPAASVTPVTDGGKGDPPSATGVTAAADEDEAATGEQKKIVRLPMVG